ncbi:hypothetical protein ACR3K2_37270 [Cryptosporidium serpentis]
MVIKNENNPKRTLESCFEWFKTFKAIEHDDITCVNIYDILIPTNLLIFIQELSPMFFADFLLTDEHIESRAKGLHFIMDGINDYLDGRFHEEINTLDYDLIVSTIEDKDQSKLSALNEACKLCGFIVVFAVESENHEEVINNMMNLSEATQIEMQHIIQITGQFGENEEGSILDETDNENKYEINNHTNSLLQSKNSQGISHTEDLENRIELLERELKEEKAARQQAEENAKKVAARPINVLEETEKLENEIWLLQNEKDQLVKDKKDLEVKYRNDIKNLQNELEMYKNEASKVAGLEQQIKKWKDKTDSLLDVKKQNEKLTKQLEDMEDKYGDDIDTESIEGGIKKILQTYKDRINYLENQINGLNQDKDDLQVLNNNLKQQNDQIQKDIQAKNGQIQMLRKVLEDAGIPIAGDIEQIDTTGNDFVPGTTNFYIAQISILKDQLNTQKELLQSEQKRLKLLESQGVDSTVVATLKQQIMIREQEAELHQSAKLDIEKRSQIELRLLSTCLHEMALKYHQCKSIVIQLDEELSALKSKYQTSNKHNNNNNLPSNSIIENYADSEVETKSEKNNYIN